MERNLENVHVVIYSKKMLKEAIKRLNNHGQNIETDIICDYEFHGNDLLIYHDGLFKVVQCLPTHPNHEVTLNDLCEMVIDEESILEAKLGDYVVTQLKIIPSPGFSVYQLTMQNSVDILNAQNSLYDFRVINQEAFERLRKDALCLK